MNHSAASRFGQLLVSVCMTCATHPSFALVVRIHDGPLGVTFDADEPVQGPTESGLYDIGIQTNRVISPGSNRVVLIEPGSAQSDSTPAAAVVDLSGRYILFESFAAQAHPLADCIVLVCVEESATYQDITTALFRHGEQPVDFRLLVRSDFAVANVPEPATFAQICAGLATFGCLGLARRNRRRSP